MSLRILTAAVCLSVLSTTCVYAQDKDPERQLQQLQAQMLQLQRQYQQQMQAMQQQLQALKQQLDTVKKARQQTAAVTAPAPAPRRSVTSQPNRFNPAISAILSGQYAHLSKDPANYALPGFVLGSEEVGPGARGLSLAESEITLSANVDNLFYGQMTTSLTPENTISVEEAYIQTLALPAGITAKFGRFKSAIGYQNSQHAHTWDFIDPPLVYRAMLGNQYADDGIQLTWLAPTDLYLELGGEAFRGDAFPASGAAHDGLGSYTLFAKLGGDVGLSSAWKLGLSHLAATARNRQTDTLTFNGDSHVNIVDFVWKWAPNGNPYRHNFKLQAEYFWGDEKGRYNLGLVDLKRHGWYAQGIYQFMPRWRAGLRYGEAKSDNPGAAFTGTALDPRGITPRRTSFMVDFSNSEFSRIRVQFNRDESTGKADDQFYVQYLMSLGSHGAHQF